MRKIASIILLFSSLVVTKQCYSQDPTPGGTTELDVPNFYKVYPLPSLDNTRIEIYQNSQKTQFFYNPFILVDWPDFKTQLDQYTSSPDAKTVDLTIKIQHLDDKVEEEIKSLLARDGNTNLNLSILPHTYYVLKARVGSDLATLNEVDIPTLASGVSLQTTHLMDKQRTYPVSSTLKNFRTFYNQRGVESNIQGFLYSAGYNYSSDYIKGTADFANSQSIKKQLFGDEQLFDNEVVNSTSTDGGLSLNLGPLKLGGGQVNSKVWTDNTKKRIVNRNYVSDLISNNTTDIHILSVGDADKIRETKNEILKFLLEKVFPEVQLEFVKKGNKEYDLVQDNITYATLKNEQVDKLLSSKPRNKVETNSEQSAAYNGASASNKDNIKSEAGDDITWQYKGNEWIPTNVTMFVASEASLTNSVNIETISVNKEGKRTIASPFIYPATWLADHSTLLKNNIVDRDNPIGTVLAFAGNADKIPVGWKLCDGSTIPVQGNEELFNAIGYSWGQLPNGDFNLPDFRGIFLRGLDNGISLDKDRVNKGQQNTVGGLVEQDAIKNHTHTLVAPFGTGANAGVVNGQNFVLEAFSRQGQTTTQSNVDGSYETRPLNFAVNYIIRIK